MQAQCSIFSTTFNPERLRTGNKILRQRLKGPALAAYYPRKPVTIADLQKDFKRFDLETWDEYEEDRLEGLQIAKLRGKGAPKKKRTADSKSLPGIPGISRLTTRQQRRKEREGNDEISLQLCNIIDMIPCMKSYRSDHAFLPFTIAVP